MHRERRSELGSLQAWRLFLKDDVAPMQLSSRAFAPSMRLILFAEGPGIVIDKSATYVNHVLTTVKSTQDRQVYAMEQCRFLSGWGYLTPLRGSSTLLLPILVEFTNSSRWQIP